MQAQDFPSKNEPSFIAKISPVTGLPHINNILKPFLTFKQAGSRKNVDNLWGWGFYVDLSLLNR
jgi:hypothetical protein